jgi:hypothetical protein
VCVEAAAGDEVCTRRPRGRRSLLCDRVREANSHDEAMAARLTEHNIEGRRKKRGQRPSLAFRARARACWGACLREGDVVCTDARVNANAPASGHIGGQDGVAHDGQEG